MHHVLSVTLGSGTEEVNITAGRVFPQKCFFPTKKVFFSKMIFLGWKIFILVTFFPLPSFFWGGGLARFRDSWHPCVTLVKMFWSVNEKT